MATTTASTEPFITATALVILVVTGSIALWFVYHWRRRTRWCLIAFAHAFITLLVGVLLYVSSRHRRAPPEPFLTWTLFCVICGHGLRLASLWPANRPRLPAGSRAAFLIPWGAVVCFAGEGLSLVVGCPVTYKVEILVVIVTFHLVWTACWMFRIGPTIAAVLACCVVGVITATQEPLRIRLALIATVFSCATVDPELSDWLVQTTRDKRLPTRFPVTSALTLSSMASSQDLHVVLLGEIGVGKTEWVARVLGHEPSQYLPTTLDTVTTRLESEGEMYNVKISDTGGGGLPDPLIQEADSLIVMYDPGRRSSFGYALEKLALAEVKGGCLVANKHGGTEEVSEQEGLSAVKHRPWDFVETDRADPHPQAALDKVISRRRPPYQQGAGVA